MESLEVTASRLQRGVDESIATVIDRSRLNARQPFSAVDMLRTVPGLDVVQAGGPGGIPYVSVRGGEPNFTLVLLDGVPVNDPTNSRGGGFDFNLIPVDSIQRLDIFKGGNSAVHGGDAMNGVINIETRAPSWKRNVSVSTRTTSKGNHGGAFFATTGFGPGAASINVAKTGVDNQSSLIDYDGKSISAKIIFEDVSRYLRGSVFYAESETEAFPEDSGGPKLARIRERSFKESKQEVGSLRGGFVAAPEFKVHSQLAWSRHRSRELSPGIAPGVINGVPPNFLKNEYERYRATLSLTREIADIAGGALGATYDYEASSDDGYIDLGGQFPLGYELSRSTRSVFAELNFRLGQILTVNAGARRDWPSNYTGRTTARIIAKGPPWRGAVEPYVSWSTNFKLPSIFALGNPLVGNPLLKPEKARNLEAGVNLYVDQLSLFGRLTSFQSEFRDLVDFDPLAFLNVNRDRVTTHGLEGELSWYPNPNCQVDFSYTYTNYDISASGAELRRRPKHKGAVTLDCEIGNRWRISSAFIATSAFYDSSIPTGLVVLNGHELLDINLSHSLAENTNLDMGIKNAMNASYEEAVGTPSPGLEVYFSVAFSFE